LGLSAFWQQSLQRAGTEEASPKKYAVMTRTRYRIFEDFRPHFCTGTIVGWLPIFTRTEAVQIILDSWRF
jgi:hypothetical protein